MLELTAGTGSIGSIGSSSFSGFQTLIDDVGGVWTLTGSNTIANVTDNGSLVIAGSLDVTTAVTSASSGQFDLQTGARWKSRPTPPQIRKSTFSAPAS